jgi:hypothetical protein
MGNVLIGFKLKPHLKDAQKREVAKYDRILFSPFERFLHRRWGLAGAKGLYYSRDSRYRTARHALREEC